MRSSSAKHWDSQSEDDRGESSARGRPIYRSEDGGGVEQRPGEMKYGSGFESICRHRSKALEVDDVVTIGSQSTVFRFFAQLFALFVELLFVSRHMELLGIISYNTKSWLVHLTYSPSPF